LPKLHTHERHLAINHSQHCHSVTNAIFNAFLLFFLSAVQYLNALGLEDACSPAGPIDPKKVAARRAAAAEGLGGMGAQTAAAIARAASGGLQHATSAVNQQQRGMQGAAARKRKQLLQEFTISNAAQAGERFTE
jgi:hypothetical protein